MLNYTIVEYHKNVQVLLEGDLDIEGTEIIDEELIPKLIHEEKVEVSFKEVPFVDSSGMGLLIKLVNTLQEENVKVTVSDVNPAVYEIFDLIQLPEILGEDVFV